MRLQTDLRATCMGSGGERLRVRVGPGGRREVSGTGTSDERFAGLRPDARAGSIASRDGSSVVSRSVPAEPGIQAYISDWLADYSGAGGFIDVQFRCGAPENAARMCNEAVDRQI